MIYFTSDLHLLHRGITRYRGCFESMKDHDDYMINEIMKLKKRDILYILGDFIFTGNDYDKYIERLSKKKCRIKFIFGNHDTLQLLNEPILEIELALLSYKNFWLSHCPIHPQEIRNRFGNIHGHLHQSKLNDSRYFNVNIDTNDYKFIEFDKIRDILTQG